MDAEHRIEELEKALTVLVEQFEPSGDSYITEVEVANNDGEFYVTEAFMNEDLAVALDNASQVLYFHEEMFGDGEDQ